MPTITRPEAMTSKRVDRSADIDPERTIGVASKWRLAVQEGSRLSTLSMASMLANRMSHERTFRDQFLLASILFRLLREGQPGAHRRPGIGPACPPGLGPPCSYGVQRSAGRGLSAGSSSVQGTSRWSRSQSARAASKRLCSVTAAYKSR